MAKQKSNGGGGKKTPKKVTPKKVTPPKRKTKLTPQKGQCTLDSFFKKKNSPNDSKESAEGVLPAVTAVNSLDLAKKQIDFSEDQALPKQDSKQTAKPKEQSSSKSVNLDSKPGPSPTSVPAFSKAGKSVFAALKSTATTTKSTTAAVKSATKPTPALKPCSPEKKPTVSSKAARTSDFSSQDESDSNEEKEKVSKLSQKLRLINGYSSHDLRPPPVQIAEQGKNAESEDDNYSIVSEVSNINNVGLDKAVKNKTNGDEFHVKRNHESPKPSSKSPLKPVSPDNANHSPSVNEIARRLSPRLHKGSLLQEGQRRFHQTSLMPPKENAFEKAKKSVKRNPFEDCESWPKPEIAKLAPDVGRASISPKKKASPTSSPKKKPATAPKEKENLELENDLPDAKSTDGRSAKMTTRSKESPSGDSGFVIVANSSFSEESLFIPATPELKPKKFAKSKSGKQTTKKPSGKTVEKSKSIDRNTSSSSSSSLSSQRRCYKRPSEDDEERSLPSSAKRRRRVDNANAKEDEEVRTRLPSLAESQGFEVTEDGLLGINPSSRDQSQNLPLSQHVSQREILPSHKSSQPGSLDDSLVDAIDTLSNPVVSTLSKSSGASSSQCSIDVPMLRCRIDELAKTLVNDESIESSDLTDGYLTSKERQSTSQESEENFTRRVECSLTIPKSGEFAGQDKELLKENDKQQQHQQTDSTNGVRSVENPNQRESSIAADAASPPPSSPPPPNDSLFDTSFGDEDFPSAEDMMTVKERPLCSSFGRHKVLSVERTGGEVRLEVETWDSKRERKEVLLRGSWAETMVETDEVINVVGPFFDEVCIVDDHSQNYVIVSPDLLVSSTAIAGALKCCRRAVLNEAYKGLEGGNIHMLKGTLLHIVFQEALKAMKFDVEFLQSVADKALGTNSVLNDLVQLGIDESDFRKQIGALLASVKLWAEKMIPGVGAAGATMNGEWSPDLTGVEVTSVEDIEENFWSPLFGIKGKVDCSAQVTIHPRGRRQKTATLPLELKTGKPNVSLEHSGQVALYALMFGMHRPERLCEGGLLVYLQGAATTFVEMRHHETQALTQRRNQLAAHVRRGTFWLPEPVDNERTCKWCPHQLSCVLYKKRDEVASGGPPMEITSHLLPSHVEYFDKWSRLIATEAAGVANKKPKTSFFWCRTSEEQEKSGIGISKALLSRTHQNESHYEEPRVIHVFTRTSPKLPDNSFIVGDTVAATPLIPEKLRNHMAIGVGTVKACDSKQIELILDRDLKSLLPEVTAWRLDKVDLYNNHASSYVNLIRLMEDSPRMKHLRELIIDFKSPTSERTCHRDMIVKTKNLLRPLNLNQQQASLRSLMAHDYVLIRGMPGAGKTSTIVALVRVLVTIGASVLLTSFTHSAVDNILLKLVETEVSFLRLGRKNRLHPKLVDYGADATMASLRRESKSPICAEDVANMYASFPVVATTCLGLKHAAVARRTFDYCIVDEASQVLQPLALGPLFHAKKFILVGDPQQLPPVVTSKEALKGGMDESLMSALMKSPGKCLVDLNVQYRMNQTINQLANAVVYGGLLKCGNDQVRDATICLQHHDTYLNDNFGPESWITKSLSKSLSSAALFLSTEKMLAFDSSVGKEGNHGGLTNVVEATLIKHLCQVLVGGGITSESVGVITPYRSQVQFLKSFLSSPVSLSFVSQSSLISTFSESAVGRDAPFSPTLLNGIEINTVDQYQGRDKSVIIVSFVRSRPESEKRPEDKDKGSMPTTILHDLRRLNVAITRAKHKVILIGNPSTLREFPPLASVLTSLGETYSVIVLPHQAHEDIRLSP